MFLLEFQLVSEKEYEKYKQIQIYLKSYHITEDIL